MKPFGLGNVGNVGNLLKQAATEEIPESVTSGHRAAGWRKEQKPAGNWKKHKILEFLAKGVRDPFGFSGKGWNENSIQIWPVESILGLFLPKNVKSR